MDAYTKHLLTVADSPLLELFAMVEEERKRSEGIHGPWTAYTPRAMVAASRAELAEVDLGIELNLFADVIREFIHTANTSCKAALELLSRGEL